MFGFFRKSEEEKLAEKGDKSAILKLIEKGKKDKAIEILERFKEDPELRPILFQALHGMKASITMPTNWWNTTTKI
jgi:fused signal recognition particle receptor